ncbi:hypothetical protein B0H34DRAFT_795392 [Crassisporium funariophilum]|nr:hypothetical protein B0H34DRAFT_795392 [Crassisporium funariophilum]
MAYLGPILEPVTTRTSSSWHARHSYLQSHSPILPIGRQGPLSDSTSTRPATKHFIFSYITAFYRRCRISYRTLQSNLPTFPKKLVQKDINLDTLFRRRNPSRFIRRMLALDEYPTALKDEEIVNEGFENAQRPSDDENPESDDDATLVAGFQDLPFAPDVTGDGGKKPPIFLQRKILEYIPGFSDDEDGHESNSETASVRSRDSYDPKIPLAHQWGPGNEIFDAPKFKIVEQHGIIVFKTALSPPPWHKPKESRLIYEDEDSADEKQPTTGRNSLVSFEW